MSASERPWRIGRSYGIHVYTDTGDKNTDLAVATFHDPKDALMAVEDHNAGFARRKAERALAARISRKLAAEAPQ